MITFVVELPRLCKKRPLAKHGDVGFDSCTMWQPM